MGLNIKNPEVEKLAAEVARLAGTSKTEAVKQGLLLQKKRLKRLSPEETVERVIRYLETEVWPNLPPEFRGKPVTKAEREEILGIGPNGYCE